MWPSYAYENEIHIKREREWVQWWSSQIVDVSNFYLKKESFFRCIAYSLINWNDLAEPMILSFYPSVCLIQNTVIKVIKIQELN